MIFSKTNVFKMLLLLFLASGIASCGNMRSSNFNKQKFTNLKSKKVKAEDMVLTDEDLAEEPATFYEEEEYYSETTENKYVDELSELDPAASDTKHIHSEEVESRQQEEAAVAEQLLVSPPPPMGTRRDFEKLSDHEKEQAIIDFNRMFNTAMFMLLLAVFSGIIALFWIWAGLGALILFPLWIFSFVPLNRLRRIDASKQPLRLQSKLNFMRLICGIGIAVCIVTILGGLILLILLAARAI